MHGALKGVYGRPFVDLEEHIDTAEFPTIDQEVSLGLSSTDPDFARRAVAS